MDVCEKNGVEIAHAEAMGLEILTKSFERGARAGVDDGAVAVGFEKRGGNGVRATGPEIVESRDRRHGGGPICGGCFRTGHPSSAALFSVDGEQSTPRAASC